MAYDPRNGAPSWNVGGGGTAATREEFDKQRELYGNHLFSSGQTNAAGGNTQTFQYGRALTAPTPPTGGGASKYFGAQPVLNAPGAPASAPGGAQATTIPRPVSLAPGSLPTAATLPTSAAQPVLKMDTGASQQPMGTQPVPKMDQGGAQKYSGGMATSSAPKPGQPKPPVATTTSGTGGRMGTGQMGQELWKNAMGAMSNPSRYDADLVKQGAKVIEDTIARMRKDGMRNLGEHHAGRGLIGSSLESNDVVGLEGQLGEQAREMAFNLQRDQANTWANDRTSAFGMGSNAAGFNENVRTNRAGEDYRDRALDQDRYFGERSADRSDIDLAGRYTDLFGPEVLESAGVPRAPGGSAPVSQAPLDPKGDAGYGTLFGEGWWDGTPEGERAYRKYF